MKHVKPISKASADKQTGWLDTLSTIISVLSVVIPLISQISAKSNSGR